MWKGEIELPIGVRGVDVPGLLPLVELERSCRDRVSWGCIQKSTYKKHAQTSIAVLYQNSSSAKLHSTCHVTIAIAIVYLHFSDKVSGEIGNFEGPCCAVPSLTRPCTKPMHGTATSGGGLEGPVIQHSSVRHRCSSFCGLASQLVSHNAWVYMPKSGQGWLEQVGVIHWLCVWVRNSAICMRTTLIKINNVYRC